MPIHPPFLTLGLPQQCPGRTCMCIGIARNMNRIWALPQSIFRGTLRHAAYTVQPLLPAPRSNVALARVCSGRRSLAPRAPLRARRWVRGTATAFGVVDNPNRRLERPDCALCIQAVHTCDSNSGLVCGRHGWIHPARRGKNASVARRKGAPEALEDGSKFSFGGVSSGSSVP